MWNIFRYKQIYGEKLPLVKIRENKLFRHRPEAIGRPVIHTHHIYLNEHIFFWMLRAQLIRICNVEMKIWGFTPSSGAFSKWLSRRKCRKTKNRNFCISTSNYHRYTQFISSYMFLRMTNRWYYLKLFICQKGLQNLWWPPILAKKFVISMKSTNMPVSILPKTKSFMCIQSKLWCQQWKIRDTWPPGGFKDVDHGNKQTAKINYFRKTAFIYHRFIFFNSK